MAGLARGLAAWGAGAPCVGTGPPRWTLSCVSGVFRVKYSSFDTACTRPHPAFLVAHSSEDLWLAISLIHSPAETVERPRHAWSPPQIGRSVRLAGGGTVSSLLSSAAFLFRFAKCRQQGMTHTTLEAQPFTASLGLASSVSSPASSGFHSTASFLAGASATSISPIREEQPGYSTDCFEYDLPSQTQYYDGNGNTNFLR